MNGLPTHQPASTASDPAFEGCAKAGVNRQNSGIHRATFCTRAQWLAITVVFVLASALRAAEQENSGITVGEILDLKRDGVRVFVFSPSSQELFVSHDSVSVPRTKLYQWNISQKKLLHTYSCPKNHSSWNEAAVSPDGKVLVAATYPPMGERSKVFFIDTQTYRVQFTAEYYHLVRKIAFDRSGKFVWIETTWPGADPFVYDLKGKKHNEFNAKDFQKESADRLWAVGGSKAGPPSGLFYRDAHDLTHRLINSSPVCDDYALTTNGMYIGASTHDRRVRIWRTADCKEIFNQEMGEHPVRLCYDSKANQFLVLDGEGGNTYLRAISLPQTVP